MCIAICFWLRPAGASEPRSISVSVAGPEQESAQLRIVLDEVFVELKLRATYKAGPSGANSEVILTEAGASKHLARVRVELAAEVIRLYVLDKSGTRVFVRVIPRESLSTQLAHEEVSQILRSTLEALNSGGTIGVAPAAPLSAAGAKAVTEPPQERAEALNYIESSGGYRLHAFAKQGKLAHGPVIEWGIVRGGSVWEGSLRVDVGYQWFHVADENFDVAFKQIPLRASIGVATHADRLRIELSVGGGANVTFLSVKAASAGVEAGPSRFFSTAVLTTRLRLSVPVFRRAHLFSTFGTDFDISDMRYIVDDEGETNTFSEPFVVQPYVGIGMSFRR